jgi:hypothetical protein
MFEDSTSTIHEKTNSPLIEEFSEKIYSKFIAKMSILRQSIDSEYRKLVKLNTNMFENEI